jgi:hypothetical protein
MKITACLGFMVLGIIIDCGGVPTDDRGYIGARYWYDQSSNVPDTYPNKHRTGTHRGAASSMASTDSAPSLSPLRSPLVELNSLVSLPPKPKIQERKSPRPPNRSSGVSASSISSTCSLLVLSFLRTATSTRPRDPPAVAHLSLLLSNSPVSRFCHQFSMP